MENLTDKDWELIEKHLAGETNEREGKIIQDRQKDNAFKKAMATQQNVFTAIEAAGDRRLKQMLQQKEAEFTGTPNTAKVRNLRRRWLGIMATAATVLLLIAFFGIQFLNTAASPDQLFAQNFEPFEAVAEATINRGNSENISERTAYTAFLQKDYTTAIAQFKALLQEKENEVMRFHLALSLLATEQATEATTILQQLDAQADFPLAEQTDWYLALALIKNKNTAAAKNKLQTIKPNAFQYEAAQKLLTQLE